MATNLEKELEYYYLKIIELLCNICCHLTIATLTSCCDYYLAIIFRKSLKLYLIYFHSIVILLKTCLDSTLVTFDKTYILLLILVDIRSLNIAYGKLRDPSRDVP